MTQLKTGALVFVPAAARKLTLWCVILDVRELTSDRVIAYRLSDGKIIWCSAAYIRRYGMTLF